jgi:hypothetical protein
VNETGNGLNSYLAGDPSSHKTQKEICSGKDISNEISVT